MMPRFQQVREEEAELRHSLTEESQVAASHASLARQESAEVAKAREQTGKLRRAMQGQAEVLGGELQDAQQAKKAVQQELAREQRQRLDELRRHRAVAADRQQVREEL